MSLIQQSIAAGRYTVEPHAFQKHGLEGFTYLDVKNAILNGQIVSRRDDEARCLICGSSQAIEDRSEFHGAYLHCVVKWDNVNMMVIITAYRPRIAIWQSPTERLPDAREGASS